MRRSMIIAAVVVTLGLTLAAAPPALAGDGHHCKGDPQACLAKMAAKLQKVAWLGVEIDRGDRGAEDHAKYAKITAVVPASPAEAAGFRAGDVLLAVNGVSMSDKEKLKKVKHKISIGDTVTYLIKRDGEKLELRATLAKAPEAVVARWVGEHMLENHLQG